MAIKPIEILINAKDNASGVFTSLQGKVAAVGAAIASYFGVQAFGNVIKGAADFEQAMSRVQAATGASGAEMKALQQAAQDAGANTKFTSVEAAGALENLAKAGLSANDAIATLPAVLQLAQAGDISLAESSEFVTKAVMGMGLAFTDAGRVADVLAMGANATNTSVQGLAQALSYAAPVANSLGVSLESTVAIIGKFADAGIDASRAGTALNSILSQFSNPASTFRRELAAAGITTNDFEKALHQLAAAGPAGSKAINAVGQEAGPALRALLNQGMGALDELTSKLRSAEGSAAATAKVMSDNLNGSLSGLSSAWQTVKDVLGTPVLPVLKDGVDQLAQALRGAVADGSVQRFGQAFATAFQGAIKWVKEFVASIDLQATVAKLQVSADEIAKIMTRIGEHASAAGNSVKTSWGVAIAGTNTLMSVIYKVAEAFAGVSSNIQSGLAMILDGFSKVTFGNLSKAFKLASDEVRLSAEATWAVSEAFADKASAALDAATEGAYMAREGFAGLRQGMQSGAQSTDAWTAAVASARAELDATEKATAAAADAQKKKSDADKAAKAAAEEHKAALAQLRGEYDALIASGNLQAAAEKLNEINSALRDTPAAAGDATKAAQETAAQVAAAFERLGVTSSAALKQQADNAKRDFEIIKTSGIATSEDIAGAFEKAANAAIAANKGIAPTWVEAEAAVRGYSVETGKAGDAVKRLADTTSAATSSMSAGFGNVTTSVQQTTQQIEQLRQRQQQVQQDLLRRYGRPGEGTPDINSPDRTSTRGEKMAAGVQEIGTGGYQFRNKDGFTSDAKGNTQQQWIWTRTAIIDYLTQAGLDKLLAEDLAKQFTKLDGTVPYEASAAQIKWGGKYSTLAEALGKMADSYLYGDNKFEGQQRTAWLHANQPGATPAPAPAPAPMPITAPATMPSMFGNQTVTIDLRLNGASYGSLNTDSNGARTLQGLLEEIERSRRAVSA